MPTQVKLEPKHFFESLPTLDHRTGDIWRSLPSFGLVGTDVVGGIVITPACDLANRKSETATYLPIVPIATYLGSAAYRYECWLEIQGALSKLKASDQVTPPNRFENPLVDEVEAVCTALDSAKRESAAGKQVLAYLTYLRDCASGRAPAIGTIEQLLTAKRLQDTLSRLITNALKPDVHFLPADGSPKDYSAVHTHSLALFRYALSIPVEILDAAQRVSPDGWPAVREGMALIHPIARHFTDWPVKLGALKDDFLSDLLSRYVSMYIRLGSRDFTSQTVAEISDNVRGS